MRFKTGTILIVMMIILVIIAFIGIDTLKTVKETEADVGSGLYETFKQANRLLLDSNEFLLRFNAFLTDPGDENYKPVIEALELIYLQVEVLEDTFSGTSDTGSFSDECTSICLIYDEMKLLLNPDYDEIVKNSSRILELHFNAADIGYTIINDSDVSARKQIENLKALLLLSGNTILIFISVMILAVINIIVLLFRNKTVKKAEEEVKGLQDFLVNIIDSMPSMIIGVDAEGIVTQWNETSFRNTGITFQNAVGNSLLSLIPGFSSCMPLIEESILTQEVRYEKRRKSLLGHEGCFEDLIIYPLKGPNLSGAVVRIDDVTEFMKMNELMIQSEKMLSVGELAAGMAHEINNPLAGMMQSADVVLDRLKNENIPANLKAAADTGIKVSDISAYMEKREILRMLSGIKDSGLRAASIVENLLSFSRKNDVAKSTHYIDDLLDRAVELSSTDYDLKKTYEFKNIKIIKNYQDGLPPIPCEGQKIQQVFLNILRNGAQAMNSYRLEKAANNILDYRPEFCLNVSRENDMIRIDIKDNGPGMSEDIRKRVFEPFFTTKPVGEGTGLGLSVSFFIITDNHQGQLSVRSEEGKGARFIIQLPAYQ